MGDPLADNVASTLHEHHGGLTNIHDLLSTVHEKAKIPGPEGHVFRNFLAETAKIPSWADPDKIARGQRIHCVHTPFMGLSLFSGSLVGGGQFSTAAIVTALAGNITTDPTRRINETGMLLMALAFPGSLLEQGSEAHDSLTRVRLLHSALRHWLPRSGRLKAHKDLVADHIYVEGELPINQQDLAITLGVFCYINLRSLRRMGIRFSSNDIDCYVQMWRYAGYVLGIDDYLLPVTLEYQEEFMLASMLHQGVPENIPEDATKNFIQAFADQFSKNTKGIVPASMLQTYLVQMVRYLNGNDYTSGMNIEDLGDYHWTVLLTKSFGYFFGTVIPGYVPFGESMLFNLHTHGLREKLRQRGTPIGHGAGTGQNIKTVTSRL